MSSPAVEDIFRGELKLLIESCHLTNGCCSNMALEILYIGNGWDWGNIHFFLDGGALNGVEMLCFAGR